MSRDPIDTIGRCLTIISVCVVVQAICVLVLALVRAGWVG